ncbi:MAG: hypothetical protein PHQ22_09075 [Sulfuricurvum sp.]|nr:hypothetical protein [Sulfuricurvum sp.]
MNKLLSSILLVTILISNYAHAETINSSKKIKSNDINQTMSDDEFMKQFMKLDQKEKKATEELETSKRLGKTLDEVNQLLDADKQK